MGIFVSVGLIMRLPTTALCLLFVFPLAGFADLERDVHAAVAALTRTSYAWETTLRQRFQGATTEPRLNPNAPVEVRGKFEPAGLQEIVLAPSRELPVPITAIFRDSDVVTHTPAGWLRRSEMRATPAGDRTVEFEGKQVRLARVFTVALKASAVPPLTEQLFDLLAGVKTYRELNGLIVGELAEKTIEQLWGDAQSRRAPEIQGTVIFKIGEAALTEYHVMIAIGFPNSRTRQVTWSMQQWSTRISNIGATTIELPEAAIAALEK